MRPGGPGQNPSPEPEPLADQQLRFRCTTGRPSISLSSFHIKVGTRGGMCQTQVPREGEWCVWKQIQKGGSGQAGGGDWKAPESEGFPDVSEELQCPPQNSVALASIQLPSSLFSSLPAALAPPVPPDCTLQLLIFRNGRLFRSHGNTSRPGGAGPSKRRGVATPVIFAGTSKGPTPRAAQRSAPQCLPRAPSPLRPALPTPTAPLTPWGRWLRKGPLAIWGGDKGRRHPVKEGIAGDKALEDIGIYILDLSNFKKVTNALRVLPHLPLPSITFYPPSHHPPSPPQPQIGSSWVLDATTHLAFGMGHLPDHPEPPWGRPTTWKAGIPLDPKPSTRLAPGVQPPRAPRSTWVVFLLPCRWLWRGKPDRAGGHFTAALG